MKNIISTKYLLEQEKKRRKKQEERVALEQQKLQHQQEVQDNEGRGSIKEGLRLSYVAYNDHRVAKQYLSDHSFSNFLPLSSWIGTQGFCCIRDKKACLVFRGTDSLLDMIVDLSLIPFYRPTSHFGFSFSWRRVRKEVYQWLKDQKETFDSVALYGHSLGGAIAHIAAFDLASTKESDIKIAEVVTFGAPRSSFLFTGKAYDNFQLNKEPERTLGSVTIRVVNKLDLISKVPFSWIGYRHVGKLVYLSAEGEIYYDDHAYLKKNNERFLLPVFRFFEQENSAYYDASISSLVTKEKYLPSSEFGIQEERQTLGKQMLDLYHHAKLYVPFIQYAFQFLFILIAPFILLFGTLLFLMRSGSSHVKLDYANYFFESTSRLENDLEIIKNRLKIRRPSLIKKATGRFIKAIILTVLAGGILYACYWLFLEWTWPIFIDTING